MKKSTTIILIILGILILITVGILIYRNYQKKKAERKLAEFSECVKKCLSSSPNNSESVTTEIDCNKLCKK